MPGLGIVNDVAMGNKKLKTNMSIILEYARKNIKEDRA
jgi:hypothetical protein